MHSDNASTHDGIVVSDQSGFTVISFADDEPEKLIHVYDARFDALEKGLLEIVLNADPPWVVVDVSHTCFGSAFAVLLFRIWKSMTKKNGGAFGVCGVSAASAAVLDRMHLSRLFGVYESRRHAIRSMRIRQSESPLQTTTSRQL